jgi:hypothetical protein
LICDYNAPEPITQVMLDQARQQMITALNAKNLKYIGPNVKGAPPIVPQPLRIHWDSLVFCDVQSPYFLNFRHYHNYNQRILQGRAVAATAAEFNTYQILGEKDVQTITAAVEIHGVQPIAESLMDGGVYPGFTIIQFPHGDTWDHRNLNLGGMFSSGWAYSPRGVLVFYTEGVHRAFMCYSGSSNVAHELGHGLALPHQIPEPSSGDRRAHQPSPDFPNQTPKAGETNCVMSYYGSYGEFCGKCVMALRGWKVSVTTWSNPDGLEGATGQSDGV